MELKKERQQKPSPPPCRLGKGTSPGPTFSATVPEVFRPAAPPAPTVKKRPSPPPCNRAKLGQARPGVQTLGPAPGDPVGQVVATATRRTARRRAISSEIVRLSRQSFLEQLREERRATVQPAKA